MSKFIIEGGKKLKGEIVVNSAKNSAMSILCASLLLRGKVLLKDMPKIQEVDRMLEIFTSIGVKVKWLSATKLELDTSTDLKLASINKSACEAMRSSLMLIGSLAARLKKYKLYKSGGCRLGERTIKPHLFALEKFGIKINSTLKFYEIVNTNLKAAEVIMYEQGDTPTENAIMAAVLTPGISTIKFASSNYMVQDLCYFLQKAGAKIEGIGGSILKITGVKKLNANIEYSIMPDPIEAMAWISLAVTTASGITIKGAPLDFLELEMEKLRVMGQKFVLANLRKSINNKFNLADITFFKSKLTALPDKIHAQPFPGINIDNLPFFVPLLSLAKGRTLVHDWVYENRAIYYLELQKLGAKITLLDPHRVFVEGPSKFIPNELVCPPAIRPAMCILIAMLAAPGRSILHNPYVIERGYENLAQRLQKLGACIRKEG